MDSDEPELETVAVDTAAGAASLFLTPHELGETLGEMSDSDDQLAAFPWAPTPAAAAREPIEDGGPHRALENQVTTNVLLQGVNQGVEHTVAARTWSWSGWSRLQLVGLLQPPMVGGAAPAACA